MLFLAAAFFVTAALYASVGFGGGSTYTALLTLGGVGYETLPMVSLICNIIVVSGGAFRYIRAKQVDWPRVLPLVLVSAPLAWLGGLTPIQQETFTLTLALALLTAGLLLLFQREYEDESKPIRTKVSPFDYLAGAGTGYLAGLVGIGGGIFLAPILHLTRWGNSRTIAATACLFILINSLAGLGGQFMKLGTSGTVVAFTSYWPLALAVLVGGQIGNFASLKLLSQAMVRRVTALLILYVSGQLLWRLAG
ncbi:MAG: sulfite exporter TauE/SafE family protein [Pseudomonadota bacterium]